MHRRSQYRNAPIKLKPFTKSDWMGFAGAEGWSDGSKPLIGEIDVELGPPRHQTMEGLIVVDRSGVQIHLTDEETGETMSWMFTHRDFQVEDNKEAAIGIAKSIESPITSRKLLRMGFSVI